MAAKKKTKKKQTRSKRTAGKKVMPTKKLAKKRGILKKKSAKKKPASTEALPVAKKYELYKDDILVLTFEADGHISDLGMEGTVSPYGVSPEDQSKIERYVSPYVQPPDGRRGPLYKINPPH